MLVKDFSEKEYTQLVKEIDAKMRPWAPTIDDTQAIISMTFDKLGIKYDNSYFRSK